MQKELEDNRVIGKLVTNAKSAMFGAIELHNKPIFPSRYEVSVILAINAWECLLKAYIVKYHKGKPIHNDKGITLPFLDCVTYVEHHLGRSFLQISESVQRLYEYRCKTIHWYCEGIESILYMLLRPNVLLFADFLKKYFDVDISEESNLIILPIGFSNSMTSIDFIGKEFSEGDPLAKSFISSLIKSAEKLHANGIEDGIICAYGVHLERENSIKNSDFVISFTNNVNDAQFTLTKTTKIGGYTNEKNAPRVQIDEVSLFHTIFPLDTNEFKKAIKERVPEFRETKENLEIIKRIKNNPDYFKLRYLAAKPTNKSPKKPYYSLTAVDYFVSEFNKLLER